MDKLDFKEKVWSFIFGIIAIASAVAEMISGGISWSAFLGNVKRYCIYCRRYRCRLCVYK